ncbi:YetF domain-containing protein [Salipaludibacillus sp. CF4.18]|uniref:YetF domain-containing protein n=1 Tax=Salipaludibacillus sp. CF4.18 TaxID=3373081 RepID=UPI003EE5352E
MELSELLIRLIIAYVVLFVLTRIMSRKEISQMTFFNFASAIAIGSIAATLATNSNFSIRNGIIALSAWGAFTLIFGYIDIKSKRARKLTTGEPIIVIKEGNIMEDALRSTRLDMDSLNSLLRDSSVFSVKDVDYAFFETSGKLSVMKKHEKQVITKGDLSILKNISLYPTSTEVISDGIINTTNLSRLNLNEEWLKQQLDQEGIQDLSEVFYGEVQQDGTLYIDKKDDDLKS